MSLASTVRGWTDTPLRVAKNAILLDKSQPSKFLFTQFQEDSPLAWFSKRTKHHIMFLSHDQIYLLFQDEKDDILVTCLLRGTPMQPGTMASSDCSKRIASFKPKCCLRILVRYAPRNGFDFGVSSFVAYQIMHECKDIICFLFRAAVLRGYRQCGWALQGFPSLQAGVAMDTMINPLMCLGWFWTLTAEL